MFHDRIVERLIADLFADLDHAGDLVRLSFAHQVGDGGGEDQDFERRNAALFVHPLEKVLRDDSFEGFGKCRTDFVLLFGGENVNHTVHGFGCAGGVQGAQDQVAGAGGDEGQLDGLQVPQLAYQDDVRVFS